MHYSIVPFTFDIESGSSRALQFSDELLQNMYLSQSSSSKRTAIIDFPGLKPFSVGSEPNRGLHVMNGEIFCLNGSTLYKVSSTGSRIDVGFVSGADQAIMADDGTYIYIVASGIITRCDGVRTQVIEQSVVTSPSWITYINDQFIIGNASGLFAVSNPGDGTVYNSLNFATSDVNPDKMVRGYAFNQLLYLFGEESTETWYNSGIGNPPFASQDNSLINIGLSSSSAVCNTKKYLYWLGDDRRLYQCVGAQARPVTTSSVSNKLEAMGSVSGTVLSTVTVDGDVFVVLSLPEMTLVYNETLSKWSTLASGTSLPTNRWRGIRSVVCYGKHLVADYENGNVYELDKDTYTDNGETRLRIVDMPVIDASILKTHGSRICLSELRLNMEVGRGVVTGQGSDPKIMYQFSPDGGRTYRAERHVSTGAQGDYSKNVVLYDFVNGYKIRPRIKFSEPTFFAMFDGSVVIRGSGH